MTRGLAARVAHLLIGHAISENYPTRSVEYLLSWALIGWSLIAILPGHLMPVELLAFAPAWLWGTVGLTTGFMRLFALMRNGAWKKSPYLRLAGAWLGFNCWLILAVTSLSAFVSGAPLFPMFGCLPAFLFFEAYSSYRCGQDARVA
jgi:hypothetical protein